MISQERLKELLSYNPETGEFIRRHTAGNSKSGSLAGTTRSDGYLAIKIDRKSYFSHRLAWLYCFGEFPLTEIDHINNKKTDNRLSNLRVADRYIKNQNILAAQKNSSTGVRCVYFLKKEKKYRVHFMVNGKRHHVGYYKDKDKAELACLEAKRELVEAFTG